MDLIVTDEVTTTGAGRLVSARFHSLHNNEYTELYRASENTTRELTHGRKYSRILLENIEAVVYRYLCDSNYNLIETKHKAPDGSKARVTTREPV